MKLHSFLKELLLFLFVTCFYILPSVLVSEKSQVIFSEWSFPLVPLFSVLSAFFVLIVRNPDFLKNEIYLKNHAGTGTIVNTGVAIFTFGMLFLSAGIFQLSAFLAGTGNTIQKVALPSDFIGYVFCFFSFVFSAVFEELIFRVYLPEAFKSLFNTGKMKKAAVFVVWEIVPCVIFGLCHRYLGTFAVLNAFVCHIFLRICYKKTGSFIYGSAVHGIYNILTLLAAAYLN